MIRIHESPASKNGRVRVTFLAPSIDGCERLYLVGWFSEWDESVYPMEPSSDGGWSVTLELEEGCTYQYRFRTLDGRWVNDLSGPPAPTRFGLNTSFIVSRNGLTGFMGSPSTTPPS